ncbi:hypothetical protein MJO52_05365 [Microbulbifer variabilis]|uniref:Phospholipase C/D domain-containing protein n=1 Tax=Microbulbifer variabilis TaxID=266805 RepID=A0ABY4VJD1_9GAMM|nr:hypothetical protein [Microbulbifer variabilis]USD22562.1 hypothetical protein MJO52_05365 [Microbulbifer variabilis]
MDTHTTINQFDLTELFFSNCEHRKKICDQLHGDNLRVEAITLICCHMEALATFVYQARGKGYSKAFCRLLADYGDNDIFNKIHPGYLIKQIENNGRIKGEDKKNIIEALRRLAGATQDIEDVKRAILSPTTDKAKKWIEKYLYMGTFAHIIYDFVRSRSVHHGEENIINIEEILHNGSTVPRIDYRFLSETYESLLKNFREACNSSGKDPYKFVSQQEYM